MRKFIKDHRRGLSTILNLILGVLVLFIASHQTGKIVWIQSAMGGFILGMAIDGYISDKILDLYKKEVRQLTEILNGIFSQLKQFGIIREKIKVPQKYMN